MKPKLPNTSDTANQPSHIRVLNYASADDALGDQGRKTVVEVVRAGFLEEVGWPEMVGELPAFRAPHSQPPGSSAGPSREAARPLQAAARRRLSPARRVCRWRRRRRLRGGSPSPYLSSSLALPAAFSRHHAHSSCVFPSGCARPSSLLGSCFQSPPWREGTSPSATPPPLPVRSKDYRS